MTKAELEKVVQAFVKTATVEEDNAGWVLITAHKDEWEPLKRAVSDES